MENYKKPRKKDKKKKKLNQKRKLSIGIPISLKLIQSRSNKPRGKKQENHQPTKKKKNNLLDCLLGFRKKWKRKVKIQDY